MTWKLLSGRSDARVGSRARVVAALLSVVAFSALVACGTDEPTVNPNLSPAGQRGDAIATDRGCKACHGGNGEGGVAPKWIGLYNSEVTLSDGSTVIADEEYLRRAIDDPTAQTVKGAAVVMPRVDLADKEIDDLIAYIKDLAK